MFPVDLGIFSSPSKQTQAPIVLVILYPFKYSQALCENIST
jgi:hypothetical protein